VKLSSLKTGDVVEITWDDATGESGWTTRDAIEWPIMRCRTVGYYLQHNELAVMLMDSLFEDYMAKDGTVGGMKTIPIGMVIETKRLAVANPPKTPPKKKPTPKPLG
jgi:hypothetical protein